MEKILNNSHVYCCLNLRDFSFPDINEQLFTVFRSALNELRYKLQLEYVYYLYDNYNIINISEFYEDFNFFRSIFRNQDLGYLDLIISSVESVSPIYKRFQNTTISNYGFQRSWYLPLVKKSKDLLYFAEVDYTVLANNNLKPPVYMLGGTILQTITEIDATSYNTIYFNPFLPTIGYDFPFNYTVLNQNPSLLQVIPRTNFEVFSAKPFRYIIIFAKEPCRIKYSLTPLKTGPIEGFANLQAGINFIDLTKTVFYKWKLGSQVPAPSQFFNVNWFNTVAPLSQNVYLEAEFSNNFVNSLGVTENVYSSNLRNYFSGGYILFNSVKRDSVLGVGIPTVPLKKSWYPYVISYGNPVTANVTFLMGHYAYKIRKNERTDGGFNYMFFPSSFCSSGTLQATNSDYISLSSINRRYFAMNDQINGGVYDGFFSSNSKLYYYQTIPRINGLGQVDITSVNGFTNSRYLTTTGIWGNFFETAPIMFWFGGNGTRQNITIRDQKIVKSFGTRLPAANVDVEDQITLNLNYSAGVPPLAKRIVVNAPSAYPKLQVFSGWTTTLRWSNSTQLNNSIYFGSMCRDIPFILSFPNVNEADFPVGPNVSQVKRDFLLAITGKAFMYNYYTAANWHNTQYLRPLAPNTNTLQNQWGASWSFFTYANFINNNKNFTNTPALPNVYEFNSEYNSTTLTYGIRMPEVENRFFSDLDSPANVALYGGNYKRDLNFNLMNWTHVVVSFNKFSIFNDTSMFKTDLRGQPLSELFFNNAAPNSQNSAADPQRTAETINLWNYFMDYPNGSQVHYTQQQLNVPTFGPVYNGTPPATHSRASAFYRYSQMINRVQVTGVLTLNQINSANSTDAVPANLVFTSSENNFVMLNYDGEQKLVYGLKDLRNSSNQSIYDIINSRIVNPDYLQFVSFVCFIAMPNCMINWELDLTWNNTDKVFEYSIPLGINLKNGSMGWFNAIANGKVDFKFYNFENFGCKIYPNHYTLTNYCGARDAQVESPPFYNFDGIKWYYSGIDLFSPQADPTSWSTYNIGVKRNVPGVTDIQEVFRPFMLPLQPVTIYRFNTAEADLNSNYETNICVTFGDKNRFFEPLYNQEVCHAWVQLIKVFIVSVKRTSTAPDVDDFGNAYVNNWFKGPKSNNGRLISYKDPSTWFSLNEVFKISHTHDEGFGDIKTAPTSPVPFGNLREAFLILAIPTYAELGLFLDKYNTGTSFGFNNSLGSVFLEIKKHLAIYIVPSPNRSYNEILQHVSARQSNLLSVPSSLDSVSRNETGRYNLSIMKIGANYHLNGYDDFSDVFAAVQSIDLRKTRFVFGPNAIYNNSTIYDTALQTNVFPVLWEEAFNRTYTYEYPILSTDGQIVFSLNNILASVPNFNPFTFINLTIEIYDIIRGTTTIAGSPTIRYYPANTINIGQLIPIYVVEGFDAKLVFKFVMVQSNATDLFTLNNPYNYTAKFFEIFRGDISFATLSVEAVSTILGFNIEILTPSIPLIEQVGLAQENIVGNNCVTQNLAVNTFEEEFSRSYYIVSPIKSRVSTFKNEKKFKILSSFGDANLTWDGLLSENDDGQKVYMRYAMDGNGSALDFPDGFFGYNDQNLAEVLVYRQEDFDIKRHSDISLYAEMVIKIVNIDWQLVTGQNMSLYPIYKFELLVNINPGILNQFNKWAFQPVFKDITSKVCTVLTNAEFINNQISPAYISTKMDDFLFSFKNPQNLRNTFFVLSTDSTFNPITDFSYALIYLA